MLARATERFVGIPFVDRGRTRGGCDCYGLLRLVYEEAFGILLPSLSDDYLTAQDREAVRHLISGKADPWHEVEEPDFLDGVVMSLKGVECHVGMFAGKGLVLHTGMGVRVSRVDDIRRLTRLRVTRYMRHHAARA